MNESIHPVRLAFAESLPVLLGYFCMGFAAGVLLAASGCVAAPGAWAFATSTVCISGALQFVLVDWFCSSASWLHVAILTVCLNLRYSLYGLPFLARWKDVAWWKKAYLIWTLTDETYALEVKHIDLEEAQFIPYCLALGGFDHLYWVVGVTAGALAGRALPFSSEGIDFAMSALFIVIMVDQYRERANRMPAAIGAAAALGSFLLFGVESMLIPSMAGMLTIFLCLRGRLDRSST